MYQNHELYVFVNIIINARNLIKQGTKTSTSRIVGKWQIFVCSVEIRSSVRFISCRLAKGCQICLSKNEKPCQCFDTVGQESVTASVQ